MVPLDPMPSNAMTRKLTAILHPIESNCAAPLNCMTWCVTAESRHVKPHVALPLNLTLSNATESHRSIVRHSVLSGIAAPFCMMEQRLMLPLNTMVFRFHLNPPPYLIQ